MALQNCITLCVVNISWESYKFLGWMMSPRGRLGILYFIGSPVAGSGWLLLVAGRGREGPGKGMLLLLCLKWEIHLNWYVVIIF
jgi:hypothetical protein